MSLLSAVIQGIIQGLTEFLPVSSSGHLSLFQYFTGSSGEEGLLFSILLHLGTLLAVFLAFYKTILALIVEFFHMLGDIFTGRFSAKNLNPRRRMILMLMLSLVPLLPFLLVKDFIASVSTDNDIVIEGFCFLITGYLLLTIDGKGAKGKAAANMTSGNALAVGAAQAVATMPGISRSGATISAGILAGLDRKFAIQFSFIMGIPAVLGANVLELGGALKEGLTLPIPVLAVGMLAALAFGLLAIRMVYWLAASNKFKYFGYYTLCLGAVVVAIGIAEHLTGGAIRSLFLSVG